MVPEMTSSFRTFAPPPIKFSNRTRTFTMISSWLYPQNRYIQHCRQETSSLNLKGKHVLIIGGTQGIGAGISQIPLPITYTFLMVAVARRFSALNATVSIAGRSESRAQSVLWD